jgi:hypothetical protein
VDCHVTTLSGAADRQRALGEQQKGYSSFSLFVCLVVDGWCWFILREKYCWLVADKPSEQGD